MQNKNNQEPNKLLNSICEVEIDGKMALVSLYDDLPHFEYDMTIDNLKNSNTKLKTIIQELKECNAKLEKELLHFKSVNKTLSKNITSLYKTATSEIQRKDKIIEELRQSQIVQQPTSKMFSSNNNFLKEKSDYPGPSEENNDTNQINYTNDASKELSQNDNDNITNIVVHPNRNIPKTVYYKRLCQKLVSQNETIKSNTMIPKQIENNNTNISDKITLDTNEELKNDNGLLKEMATPLIHNNPKENLSSKLTNCKSDIISSNDYNLNNTPIVHCGNRENNKENTLLPSFFTGLKSPVKLKKKMVIAPATIGVQNSPNKTLKNVEKRNRNKNVDSNTQCIINNLSKKKTIETLNKNTSSAFIKEHKDTAIEPKTKDQLLPKTDKVHRQHLSTPVNNDQILPMKIETAPVSLKNEAKIVEIDNSLTVTKLKKCSPVTCKQLSSNNEYDKSVKCKKLSMKNENKSFEKVSSPIPRKHNSTGNEHVKSIKYVKSPEHKLPVTKDVCNLTKLTESNNSLRSCSKNKSYETSLVNKTSINIDVEQIPFRTRTVKILKDNNSLESTKMRVHKHVTCINPTVDNELNMSNNHIIDLTTSDKNDVILSEQKKSQLELNSSALNHTSHSAEFTQLNSPIKNKSDETSLVKNTSINIEVEQGLFRRSNSRKVITHSSFDHDKADSQKGKRRVQLITIKDHCSEPLPSFNGAKKKEIDVSKNLIHIEKIVESSSLFYIPQVKRRRTINFGNAES